MSLTVDLHPAPVSLECGLAADEATETLRRDGPGELPHERQRGPLRIVPDAVREPMLRLVPAAGVIYLVIGGPTAALILLAFAVLSDRARGGAGGARFHVAPFR
jgi:Ca2+-transporting ATPase